MRSNGIVARDTSHTQKKGEPREKWEEGETKMRVWRTTTTRAISTDRRREKERRQKVTLIDDHCTPSN